MLRRFFYLYLIVSRTFLVVFYFPPGINDSFELYRTQFAFTIVYVSSIQMTSDLCKIT